MDWQERATATEQRLRKLFLDALAGNATAYRQFLTALGGHLRAYFRRRMTQVPDDVEDLVQEVLLAVHNSRHTYRPEQPLTAWLHTIARYKLIDFLRARMRREALHVPLDDDEMQVFAAPEENALEARRDLHELLQSVPERHRRAFLMVKVEGTSIADTAAAIGVSEAAVKVRVHRTLKALMAKVKGQT